MAILKRQRLADAVLSRLLNRSKPLHSYTVERVGTPMRDGVILLGDHFSPEATVTRGTVLIRTPYGRGFPTSATNGRLLAAHGYHVVIQSVRGTFGSGGTFEPMAQETTDGQDTVAWLRAQPWFDGRLGTLGGSYLGWTQWTMLQDPPPELRTAVVYVGPHDFRRAVFGTGAFTLGDFLGWSAQIAHQEDGGTARRLVGTVFAGRRIEPALSGLPLPDAAEPVLRGRAPWYREWLSHPDAEDPWWEPYRAGTALHRVDAPVLLVSGWQDLFLEQSLEQYAALRERGVDVALTVGPWTHLDVGIRGAALVSRETIAWLDQHMAGGPVARKSPVRVHRTGESRWHDLPEWPPPSAPAVFQPHPDGTLTTSPAGAEPASPAGAATTSPAADTALPTSTSPGDADTTSPAGAATTSPAGAATTSPAGAHAASAPPTAVVFRYDPADPTPSVGGRTLSGSAGVKDNRALEARADVVTFTTDALPTAVDVIGSPTLELTIAVDQPHADVFVRLCDVDERGRSRNFSDHLERLDPGVPAGETQRLSLTLDPCFHRLRAGHRLRLQISGGAFPRYARNLGTPGTPAHGRTLRSTERTLDCAGTRLVLPVAAATD
jgi:uncharacterized protein